MLLAFGSAFIQSQLRNFLFHIMIDVKQCSRMWYHSLICTTINPIDTHKDDKCKHEPFVVYIYFFSRICLTMRTDPNDCVRQKLFINLKTWSIIFARFHYSLSSIPGSGCMGTKLACKAPKCKPTGWFLPGWVLYFIIHWGLPVKSTTSSRPQRSQNTPAEIKLLPLHIQNMQTVNSELCDKTAAKREQNNVYVQLISSSSKTYVLCARRARSLLHKVRKITQRAWRYGYVGLLIAWSPQIL